MLDHDRRDWPGSLSDLVGAPAESDRDLEDEGLATDAAHGHRTGDRIDIEPDEEMRSLLASDEQLIAIRETADVERLIMRAFARV